MPYRARVYERYTSTFLRRSAPPSPAEMRKWYPYRDVSLRGWLPAKKDAAIVDVGCGFGWFLSYLTDRGYTNVHGVDTSAEQVALARQRHANVHQGEVTPFLADRPEQFDLIMAMDVIEHMKKEEVLDFLDRSFAALRSGGRFIVQTINGESPWHGADWHGDFTHETCFTPKSMRQVLELCGFHHFEAREQGPVAHGLRSAVRLVLWKMIRAKLLMANVAETGSKGSGIMTRTFVATGVKP